MRAKYGRVTRSTIPKPKAPLSIRLDDPRDFDLHSANFSAAVTDLASAEKYAAGTKLVPLDETLYELFLASFTHHPVFAVTMQKDTRASRPGTCYART